MSRFIPLLCLLAVSVAAAVVVLLLRSRRPRDAGACFERGNALFEAGKHAEACEEYARAVVIDPRLALAYYNWGLALGRLDRQAEACEKFARVVAISPRSADAHYQWSLALGELGRYAESCEKCERATALNPHLAEAYLSCGLSLDEMGKRGEAIEKLEKAIELKPDLTPTVDKVRRGWDAETRPRPSGEPPLAKGETEDESGLGPPAQLTVNPELVGKVQHLGVAGWALLGGPNADYAPDSQRLAFLKSRAASGYTDRGERRIVFAAVQVTDLWTTRADGSGLQRVTRSEGGRSVDEMPDATNPRWSPDGRSLAYLSGSMLGGRVVLFDVTTGKSAELDFSATAMRWAPDSQSLAIVGCKHEAFPRPDRQLYVAVIGVDGRAFSKVADVSDGEIGDWSPDGLQLLYTTWGPAANHVQWVAARIDESQRQNCELWVAKPDGSAPARVATRLAGPGLWSPAAQWIAYTGDRTEPGLWRVHLATGERECVIQGLVRVAQWACHGERLFYTLAEGGEKADLYLLQARAGGKHRLTTSGNVVEAQASPDGAHAVVIARGQAAKGPRHDMYLLDLKGRAVPQRP